MAEFFGILLLAPFVWIGQQHNRWREWRDRRRCVGMLRVMRLEARDAIVLQIKEPLSQQRANEVEAILQAEFPDHKVVVLHGGWELSVLKVDDLALTGRTVTSG